MGRTSYYPANLKWKENAEKHLSWNCKLVRKCWKTLVKLKSRKTNNYLAKNTKNKLKLLNYTFYFLCGITKPNTNLHQEFSKRAKIEVKLFNHDYEFLHGSSFITSLFSAIYNALWWSPSIQYIYCTYLSKLYSIPVFLGSFTSALCGNTLSKQIIALSTDMEASKAHFLCMNHTH